MIFLTPVVGYLIGSLPTANGLARLWGANLRSDGSGNPGAANAHRTGGFTLAAVVLLVEIGKGLLAVVVGLSMAGDLGGILAGIGAAAGNVYNVWYGFDGGKGLGISSGVVIGLWPTAYPVFLAVLITVILITRASGIATLVTLATVVVLSFLWPAMEWEMAWGIDEVELLPLLGIGLTLVLMRKHLFDARNPLRRPSRP